MERFSLNQVEQAINALKEYFAKENDITRSQRDNQLFTDNRLLHLNLTLKKLPVKSGQKFIEICLPHKFLDRRTTSICLIVKDINKRRKRDTEKSVNTFKAYLDEHDVDGIDEMISLKQLKIEYRTFESKRKLCSAYDLFLVDDRIATLVTQYMGKTFFDANKFPQPIRISRGNINEHLEKCLSTSRFYLKNSSSRCCLKFGLLDQSTPDLLENVDSVVKKLQEKLPGSFQNIRTISINVNDGPMLPVFACTESANSVKFEPSSKKPKPVVDSLDTIGRPDTVTNVRVWPTGKVDIMEDNKDNTVLSKKPARRKWNDMHSAKSRARHSLLLLKKSSNRKRRACTPAGDRNSKKLVKNSRKTKKIEKSSNGKRLKIEKDVKVEASE